MRLNGLKTNTRDYNGEYAARKSNDFLSLLKSKMKFYSLPPEVPVVLARWYAETYYIFN